MAAAGGARLSHAHAMHAPSDPPPPAWVYGGSAVGPISLPPWLPPPPPLQQPLPGPLPPSRAQPPPPPPQPQPPPASVEAIGMASVMRALRSRNIALQLELQRVSEALAAAPAGTPAEQQARRGGARRVALALTRSPLPAQSAAQQRAALLERQLEAERTRCGALQLRAETAEAERCARCDDTATWQRR